MKVAVEEWIEKQYKNIENGVMSGNSKEAYIILKAFTKNQQHKSAVIEDSSGNVLTEAQLFQTGELSTAVAYTTTNSTQTTAYSRPPHKRLKVFLC